MGWIGLCCADEIPSAKSLMQPEVGEGKTPCKCGAVYTSLTHPRFVLLRVGFNPVKFPLVFFLTESQGEMSGPLL